MNYKIIENEESLREFIDFLPELEKNETFFLCLQIRKKYLTSIRCNAERQLRRFTSSKKYMFEQIRQLEVPFGAYKIDGQDVPNEALVLYLNVNPRDMKKATYNSINKMVDLLQQNERYDLDWKIMTEIHKAKSKTKFVHFDIDLPTGEDRDKFSPKNDISVEEVYRVTSELVGADATNVVCTRGGYHVLITLDKVQSKIRNWHSPLKDALGCDQVGDLMIPMVGCCQGGFVPYIWRPENGTT